MSATLPEIPDEAVDAAEAALTQVRVLLQGEGVPESPGHQLARAIITAAQPHLYAASLRHAADECWPFSRDMLRRIADEATSGLRG